MDGTGLRRTCGGSPALTGRSPASTELGDHADSRCVAKKQHIIVLELCVNSTGTSRLAFIDEDPLPNSMTELLPYGYQVSGTTRLQRERGRL